MVEDIDDSQERAYWFYKLRTHPDLVELVDKVDEFDVSVDELYDEEIRQTDSGELLVFLRLQDSEVTHYIVRGVFDSDSESLLDVYVKKSDVFGPMAEEGTQWRLNNGDVISENKLAP